MACSCKNRQNKSADIPHEVRPEEPCAFCAEKHFSTAMQLIHENGYVAVNRQRIIGELVLAQWHVYKMNYELAVKMRDLRHYIENREEDKVTDAAIEDICNSLDALIAEVRKA